MPTHCGGSDAVPAREGVVEDAAERIRDEDAHQCDSGRRVDEAPQPLRAVGPSPSGGCVRRDQGFSDLIPLSTFCMACGAVTFPEKAAWSCW